jgi:hypothetical protein
LALAALAAAPGAGAQEESFPPPAEVMKHAEWWTYHYSITIVQRIYGDDGEQENFDLGAWCDLFCNARGYNETAKSQFKLLITANLTPEFCARQWAFWYFLTKDYARILDEISGEEDAYGGPSATEAVKEYAGKTFSNAAEREQFISLAVANRMAYHAAANELLRSYAGRSKRAVRQAIIEWWERQDVPQLRAGESL